MGKFVAGEIVVLPFPQTNLQSGKRHPALVVANFAGNDIILCQITSQIRSDPYSVTLTPADIAKGGLAMQSYARINRLFTVEESVIVYGAARVTDAKLAEVRDAIRQMFT